VEAGAVEVSILTDPDRRLLIEAGRGVLVQPGQDFHLLGLAPGVPGKWDGDRNEAADHGHHEPPVGPAAAAGPHGADGHPGAFPVSPAKAPAPHATDGGAPGGAGANVPGAPGRYVAALADVAQLPFLFRFNAYPEAHLDSLENPAYATGFQQGEGRVFVLPSWRGASNGSPGTYSTSPQVSMFSPIGGSNFSLGGSFSASRVGNLSPAQPDFGAGAAGGTFYSPA